MRLFIDTGSVAEVEEIAAWGVLSGATTNPSLLAKEDGDPGDIIRRICELVDGPVSAEVVADDAAGMIAEGHALAALHEHVVVKVPFSPAGPRRHERAQRGRHRGQHDARLHRQPGTADRRGGRDVRLLLPGPPRRRLDRLGRGARRHRRGDHAGEAEARSSQPRSAAHSMRSWPPASAARSRRFRARSCARCSTIRSPPPGSSVHGRLAVAPRVRHLAARPRRRCARAVGPPADRLGFPQRIAGRCPNAAGAHRSSTPRRTPTCRT